MKAPKYNLIPLWKIEPVAQKIAVAWVENFKPIGGTMLNDKQKLASDLMNYAENIACEFAEWYLQNENKYNGSVKSIYNAWVNAGRPSLIAQK